MSDKPFRLVPSPEQASDTLISQLFEDELKIATALQAALDQIDNVMHKPHEIDLRGKNLDIRYEYHGSFRGVDHWSCWDARNYTGVDSPMGEGESKQDALADLLEKTAADAPKPRAPRVIHSSAFEPPTYADDRDVNFDDDLEDQA
jgi:hypothetical protein